MPLRRKKFAIAALAVGLLALSVYAIEQKSGPRMAMYSFDFGSAGTSENTDVEILNYKYGDSHLPGTYVEDERVATGHIQQRHGTYGRMPVDGSLYVKWRVVSTGKVYEETADLKGRLPSDMNGKIVHFTIVGSQLYVYVIEGNNSTQLHAKGAPDCPVPVYSDLKCSRIYPTHWTNF